MSNGIRSFDREEGEEGILAGIRRLRSLFFGERSDTGYIPEVSESIYHAVKPWSATSLDPGAVSDLADAMSRIVRGDPGAPREGDDLRPGDEEDAWRTYLGLPQKHGTFEESRFRPSVGSGEKIRYRDFVDQERVLNELVQKWSMVLDPEDHTSDKVHVSDFNPLQEVQERSKMIRRMAKRLDDKLSGMWGDQVGGPYHTYSDVLGTFTLDKGEDERGPYLSYYDKYDLAHLPAQIAKVGQPFDVYGRMYYDPETYEYLPQTQSDISPTSNGIRSLPRVSDE